MLTTTKPTKSISLRLCAYTNSRRLKNKIKYNSPLLYFSVVFCSFSPLHLHPFGLFFQHLYFSSFLISSLTFPQPFAFYLIQHLLRVFLFYSSLRPGLHQNQGLYYQCLHKSKK